MTLSFDAMQYPSVTCSAEQPEDRPGGAAGAFPGVADAPEPVAPKLSARLLDAYGADPDSMKSHE